MHIKLKADFFKDLNNIIKLFFYKNKFSIKDIKDDDFIMAYLNYVRRNISPKKRKVVVSDCFHCPENRIQGWEKLRKAIENGDNIKDYQSKFTSNLKKFDLLLTDWNIYHLHLGEESKDGGIERTKELVFCIVEEDILYAINIFKHGDWVKKDILEIVLRNWPHLIEKYKIPLIHDDKDLTEDEMKALRKKRYNFSILLSDGNSYFPGYGHVSNGYSLQDRIRINQTKRYLDNLKKSIEEDIKNNPWKFALGDIPKPGSEIECVMLLINDLLFIHFPRYSYLSFYLKTIDNLLKIH